MKIKNNGLFFCGIIFTIILFCFPSVGFTMGTKKIFPKPWSIEVITRTGSLKIVRPDGKEFTVDLEEKLPWIPSGSQVQVMWGRAQLKIGVVEVVIKKEGRIKLWGKRKTGTIHIMVPPRSKTNIKVTVGDTIVIVNERDRIKVMVDEFSKIAKITMIKGEVEIVRGEEEFIASQGMVIVSLLDVKGRILDLSRPKPEVIEEIEASPYSP